jgi:alpha-L-fucosidase
MLKNSPFFRILPLGLILLNFPATVWAQQWDERLGSASIAIEEPGYHVWGSSPVIGPHGKTHLFAARWPLAAKFRPGWYTDCEIAHYVSEKPEGPYRFQDVVLRGSGRDGWARKAPHNPTIQKVGDHYALFYIANPGENFPASQQIGLLLADSPDGPWVKAGLDGLILATPDDPEIWSSQSVVGVNNPALLQHPDGRFFLYYKAMRKGDVRRMGVAIADQIEGPYHYYPTPLTSNQKTIEDGYAFVEGNRIYLITTDNAAGAGLLWQSEDGIHFDKAGQGYDRMETYFEPSVAQGTNIIRSLKFERPQVLLQGGRATHLFVAGGANTRGGEGTCSYVIPIATRNVSSIEAELPKPTPAQQIWQDCEVGVIFHFDISIVAGDYYANNSSRKVFDPLLYDPQKLDTDQWAAAAKAAGAQYAVFTATHFKGFLQWQSDLYPYGLKQAAWRDGKGDILADFVESCRKVGLRPGVYFSTHRNAYQKVWGHYVDWGKGKGSPEQAAFNRLAEKMTEEICMRYGDLVQIWYDAGVMLPHEGGPDVLPIFTKYQPNSVFYNSSKRLDHRWIGNEGGLAGEPCWATLPNLEIMTQAKDRDRQAWRKYLLHGDPLGSLWSPGMVDFPLRGAHGIHDWFWAPDHAGGIFSVEKLVENYYQSVGRNSNFLIGVVINPDGLVPDADAQRLAEFGAEIERRFSRPIAQTSSAGSTAELALDAPQAINHVVIMEDIAQGERIRRYRVEGLNLDNQWQVLCVGTSVGHKRIQNFPTATVRRVRLSVLQAVAPVKIRQLAVFAID